MANAPANKGPWIRRVSGTMGFANASGQSGEAELHQLTLHRNRRDSRHCPGFPAVQVLSGSGLNMRPLFKQCV
jgi:hypothetical protein